MPGRPFRIGVSISSYIIPERDRVGWLMLKRALTIRVLTFITLLGAVAPSMPLSARTVHDPGAPEKLSVAFRIEEWRVGSSLGSVRG
jgi:hypothetical protein